MPTFIPALAQEPEAGPTDAIYDFVLELTDQTWAATVAARVVPSAFQILLIIVLAYVANRLVRRVIKRSVRRLAQEGAMSRLGAMRPRALLGDTTPMDIGRVTLRAETIAGVLRSLAGAAVWTIAVIMILGEFNVNLGPLIAGAGIVGVALGFGSQKLVQDFLSGIFMLVEDQYGLGDIVDTGEATGVVEGITLRTTRLRDVNGTVWHVPNGQINRIGNMSQQWARALLDVGVAYDTDIPFATGVIKRVADEIWQDPVWGELVLEEPEVWGVEAFGASEILIRLVIKTQPGKQFAVSREIRERLKHAFDAEGIEIPFPQRTVWFKNDDGSTAQNAHDPDTDPTDPAPLRRATDVGQEE